MITKNYELFSILTDYITFTPVGNCENLKNSQAYKVTPVVKYNITYEEQKISHVEAGSNTSAVTLPVIEGDERGSLESETVKYDRESHGTWTRE
jgi:hypothetical protein